MRVLSPTTVVDWARTLCAHRQQRKATRLSRGYAAVIVIALCAAPSGVCTTRQAYLRHACPFQCCLRCRYCKQDHSRKTSDGSSEQDGIPMRFPGVLEEDEQGSPAAPGCCSDIPSRAVVATRERNPGSQPSQSASSSRGHCTSCSHGMLPFLKWWRSCCATVFFLRRCVSDLLQPYCTQSLCYLQTGFDRKYQQRREHARKTWFPATEEELIG